MKPTNSIVMTVLLTSLAASTHSAPSGYNGCSSIDNNGFCVECFKRKVLSDGKGCGPLQPKSDKCLFYIFNTLRNSSACSFCKTGYAYRVAFNGTELEETCVPGALSNCILEIDFAFSKKTERLCEACGKGLYSVKDAGNRTSTCKKVTKPLQNCEWGSFYDPKLEEGGCIRCDAGFAVDLYGKQCVDAVETGCWLQDRGGRCVACDPFAGYSIDEKGTCFKTSDIGGGVQDAEEMRGSEKGSLGGLGLGGF